MTTVALRLAAVTVTEYMYMVHLLHHGNKNKSVWQLWSVDHNCQTLLFLSIWDTCRSRNYISTPYSKSYNVQDEHITGIVIICLKMQQTDCAMTFILAFTVSSHGDRNIASKFIKIIWLKGLLWRTRSRQLCALDIAAMLCASWQNMTNCTQTKATQLRLFN